MPQDGYYQMLEELDIPVINDEDLQYEMSENNQIDGHLINQDQN